MMADRDRLLAMGDAARATGGRGDVEAHRRRAARCRRRRRGFRRSVYAGNARRRGRRSPADRRRRRTPDAGAQHVRRLSAQLRRQEAHLLPVPGARPAAPTSRCSTSARPAARRNGANSARIIREIRDSARRALRGRRRRAAPRRCERSVTDIAALLHAHEIPALASAIKELAANADVVMASHVYLAPLIARHWTRRALVRRAQRRSRHEGRHPRRRPRSRAPFADDRLRGAAIENAMRVAAVAAVARAEGDAGAVRHARAGGERRERRRFAELYGRDAATIEYAPNGVSLPDDAWLDPARRAALKASLGFADRPVALFVGSDHGPNHDAADDPDRRPRRASVPTGRSGSSAASATTRNSPTRRRTCYRLGVVSRGRADGAVPRGRRRLQPDAARLRHQSQDARLRSARRAGAVDGGRRARSRLRRRHALRRVRAGRARAGARQRSQPELPSPRLAMRTAAREHVETGHFRGEAIADRIVLPATGDA